MEYFEKVLVVVLAIIILIPFIFFMAGFFVYYLGKPSTVIEKTLFEAGDIYLNVSKDYEYRIILSPSANFQYSPKQLMVTVTQNSLVVKQYASKLGIKGSCYEGSCMTADAYDPEYAAFIPEQNGEIKISINVLESGQSNMYFVKVYEGGAQKLTEVCVHFYLCSCYLWFHLFTFQYIFLRGGELYY